MKSLNEDMKAILVASWKAGDPDCAPKFRLISESGRVAGLLTAISEDDPLCVHGLFHLTSDAPIVGRHIVPVIEQMLGEDRLRIEYISSRTPHPLSVYACAAHSAGCIVDDETRLQHAATYLNDAPQARRDFQLKAYSVQCVYAAYYGNLVSVFAADLKDALSQAIGAADGQDSWKSLDDCGATFVSAACEGFDADPWRDAASELEIPETFAEGGEPPTVTIAIRNGRVDSVDLGARLCRVVIRDYDLNSVEHAVPFEHGEDDDGRTFVESRWGVR